MTTQRPVPSWYTRFGKRGLDVIAAGAALLLLAPLLLLLSLLVWTKLGRPVIFRQVRPGLDGQEFQLCKFRSMSDARDSQGRLLDDAKRLGRFGCWLRATSLDELPELWNVLRGDMSLVGPRPLLPEYLSLYSAVQARRHEVRPGLTGWAQVNGRNATSWSKRLELDVWYVDRIGFWLDVRIVLLTVLSVVKREGISAEGEATMPRFKGASKL